MELKPQPDKGAIAPWVEQRIITELLLPLHGVSLPEVRKGVLRLEAFLKTLPDLFELPVKHHFAPGTYAREAFLPAGSIIVGKIHRHAHLNIVSRGDVTTLTEVGLRRIDAREFPVTFPSLPGMKRALYVHADTVWTTIHLTDKRNLEEIEAELIAPSFEDFERENVIEHGRAV